MNQFIIKAISLLMVLITLGESAPVVVTRYHTAANHATVTQTRTTGTTTVTMPVVEIFISNGVTYTFTLSTTATATATGDDEPTVTGAGTQTIIFTDGGDTSTLAQGATITTAPTTTSTSSSSSSSSSDWTSTTETITLTTTVTLADGSDATSTLTTEQQKEVDPTTSASSDSTVTSTSSTSTSSTSTTSTSSTSTTSTSSTSTTSTSSTKTTSTSSTSTTSTSSTSTTSTSSTSTTSTSSTASSSSAYLSTPPTAIVYSPYNNDGTCKGSSSVKSDLQLILSKNIATIRVYGTDCNSINTVEPAAAALGLKINQGFWIDSDGVDSIDSAVDDLISWASSNTWDVFDFITIGNEAILSGYATVDDLINKISSVKTKLKNAGYTGKVTTSEPPVVFENNPNLCTDSDIDFVGVNSHSYFDVNSSADEAGSFVAGQLKIVKNVCGDLDVFVTETGYPSKGDTNGKNVPSVENQKIAIKSLLDVVGTDITILSTYNDLWKSPGDYGIEQSFGAIQLF